MTVEELIRAYAAGAGTSQTTALSATAETSFSELYARARTVAGRLQDAGAGRGTAVAALLPNSAGLLEVALGAMFCGAEFLPLSSALVPRELAVILGQVTVSVWVTDTVTAPTVASVLALLPQPLAVCPVDALCSDPPAASTSVADLADVRSADGAWITMSGGTTGSPKLYRVSHESLVSNLLLNALEWGWRTCGTHVAIAPMAHGIGFCGVFGQLITGGPVAIAGPYDPARALDLVRQQERAWTAVVPTILRDLALSARDTGPCSSLRLVICAGSRLSGSTRELAATAFPAATIVEYYGSTEMGWVTWIGPSEAAAHPGSVGRAAMAAEVVVRRDDGSRTTTGESGTIWKRGRPYSTPVTATGDEMPGSPGSWTTSHDVGTLDDDGYLYLQGRGDELIISGGMNVFAAEVEQILGSHAAVRDCVVVGLPDERWGEQVIAVVVVDGTASPDDRATIERELASLSQAMLASYKRPKRIIFSPDIPRTASAKPSRTAVREHVSNLLQERELTDA